MKAASPILQTPLRWLRHWIRWLGGLETLMLASLVLLVVGLWGFAALTGEVLEGDTQWFDDWAVRVMRNPQDFSDPLGPEWLEESARDATAMGGIAWLLLVTLAVTGFVLLNRKPHMAGFLLGSIVGGLLASSLLKAAFARPRPELVPHLSHVYTSSFPSGHSMLSAVVYLTLGALLATIVKRPVIKVYVLSIALVITLLVGISRVYLGVHYPSDVAAGWMAGLVWSLACLTLARTLQRRGRVESSGLVQETPADRVLAGAIATDDATRD